MSATIDKSAPGHFCSLENLYIFKTVGCTALNGRLQAGPAIIEIAIEIAIEIGKLPEIDFDHDFDFDFDTDSEHP